MTRPYTKAQASAQKRYDLRHTTGVTLKLHNDNDRDIIDWLRIQDNKQGAIKAAIRDHIKKTTNNG